MKKLCYLAVAAALTTGASCSDDETSVIVPPDGGADLPDTGAPSSGPSIPGLTAPVRVEYDEFGLAHIRGKTDADVFAALGYTHAANRFFFMDFVRRAVRGQLGELLQAPGVVDQDVTSRTFFATPTGDPLPEKLVDELDETTRAYFTAYATGINAWLADLRAGANDASVTEEYRVLGIPTSALRDWELADSAAVALYVLNDLSNNADYEATLGQAVLTAQALASSRPLVAKTLQDVFLDLRPTFDTFTVPAATTAATTLAARANAAKLRDTAKFKPLAGANAALRTVLGASANRLAGLRSLAPRDANVDHGSNNWVLAGSRTTNGRPLLANDPHLALTNPSIWFPVEIDAKSDGGTGVYHAAGGGFPGLPAVLTGHNESIAWGVTVAYWDLSDLYVEQLTKNGAAVSFQGADVDLVTKSIEFMDQGQKVTRTLAWVPHHGPIIALNSPAAGQAVSVRWLGHGGSTDAQAFFELGRASNVAEARTALTKITTAAQNFVVADKAGAIGWYPFAKVPSRPWVVGADMSTWPIFPQPGDGSREWGPAVPVDALPQLTNPPRNAIFTANQDLTGATADGNPFDDGNAATQAADMAEGTRAEEIRRQLEAGANGHSLATMHAIQGDTKSLLGERIAPRMIEAAGRATGLDANAQSVVTALGAWTQGGTFACPSGVEGPRPTDPVSADAAVARDSAGCLAFHTALYALFDATFRDEQSDPQVSPQGSPLSFGTQNQVKAVMRSFVNAEAPQTETFWDDVSTTDIAETRDAIVVRALTKAGTLLQAARGAPATWQWGAVHTLTLLSPLAAAVPIFNDGPYATPGGLYTVNVANPSSVNLNAATPADALRFVQTNGPSIRTVIEVGADHPRMQIQLPGGSDLHRTSPFYSNLVPRWTRNEAVDFAFGPGAVTAPAKTVDLRPATP